MQLKNYLGQYIKIYISADDWMICEVVESNFGTLTQEESLIQIIVLSRTDGKYKKGRTLLKHHDIVRIEELDAHIQSGIKLTMEHVPDFSRIHFDEAVKLPSKVEFGIITNQEDEYLGRENVGKISLKQLSIANEAAQLTDEFARQFPWYSPSDYYATCLAENQAGSRVTLIAELDGKLAGCCHLKRESAYPYFREQNIPEINDLNVFPAYRRQKVASALLDELERIAAMYTCQVGLGVGLYSDYGNAQRMYTRRGYVLDGNGVMYKNQRVEPGCSVRVDDDLLLYLIKDLRSFR